MAKLIKTHEACRINGSRKQLNTEWERTVQQNIFEPSCVRFTLWL